MPLDDRLRLYLEAWAVVAGRIEETHSSLLAVGRRGDTPVVLKIIKARGDEWDSGAVVSRFRGKGCVRVLAHEGGAVLLERLDPGTSLASVAMSGGDDEAVDAIAAVIRQMSGTAPASNTPSVREWGMSFERYACSGRSDLDASLVDLARRVYFQLCAAQSRPRLLHGDLHHYNVLFDARRGWTAIDPKGVVGEDAYEVGAALRNPYEKPELFTNRSTIERRVERFSDALGVDAQRIIAWGFAQAVLAALWAIEDGLPRDDVGRSIALAETVRPLVRDDAV